MYVTLSEMRTYLSLKTAETGEDAHLLSLLDEAEKIVKEYENRDFEPKRETRYYEFPSRTTKSLDLGSDLLELESIMNGDNIAIPTTECLLLYLNLWPKRRLEIKTSSSYAFEPDPNGDNLDCEEITGLWGYHENYPEAFVDSLDTVQSNSLTIVGTSMSVNLVTGVADDDVTPRFYSGLILRLGSSSSYELVKVTAVTTGVVTIRRAYRGTIAQAWVKGTPIYIWRHSKSLKLGVKEYVRYLNSVRQSDFQGIQEIVGTGVKISLVGIPTHILDILPPPRIDL